MSDEASWPEELRVSPDKKTLTIKFDDGSSAEFTAEFLRVHSPSAEVQGHSREQKQTVSGKQSVAIMKIEQVGNYAVRINFDDMHNTGIFSWSYFHEMADQKDELWAAYLAELEDQNLQRGK
tara:strand:+ start:3178 stop:3543 length:366 start_codon:yes stop_codon:yes gene_type:complete